MTIEERIKYAEQRRDEAFSNGSLQSIVYWDGYIAALKDVCDVCEELTAKNESLEAAIESLKEECLEQGKELKRVKTNAIQAFAERLKRYYDRNDKYLGYSIAYNIDQVAQAMINGSPKEENE